MILRVECLLLLHDKRSHWVQYILVFLSVSDSKDFAAKHTRRSVELLVFHQKEALSANRLFSSHNGLDRCTKHWQSHMLVDNVRVSSDLNNGCMLISLTELTDKALLNDLLMGSLVIGNL